MEPYVGRHVGVTETDPKKLTSFQELIRILKEEYLKHKEQNATAQVFYTNNQSLGKHNQGQCKSTGTQCQNCKHDSHTTDNCRWLGKPKCDKCGWFGYVGADCRRNLKRKNEDSRGGKQKQAKKEQPNSAQEQVNLAMETGSAHIEEIVFSANNVGGTHSPDKCNVSNEGGNDDAIILYDWLADSATT